MNRVQAINKIKKTYEEKQLGFQKGASGCRYYDKVSDSHCAVGVLIGKNKSKMNQNGNITEPFKRGGFGSIRNAMDEVGKSYFCGLSVNELATLQSTHDNCVTLLTKKNENKFKEYLYGLKEVV